MVMERKREIDTAELISSLRLLESDHKPDDWPAVQMYMISNLLDALENAIPSIDLLQAYLEKGTMLQAHLEKGAKIEKQGGEWHLFHKDGNGIASGKTLQELLINLIFVEC